MGASGSTWATQGTADTGPTSQTLAGGGPAAPEGTAGADPVRRAAHTVAGLFTPVLPHAPGARIICGTAEPALLGPAFSGFTAASVAGCSARPNRAYERCLGEAVEYLSQLSPDKDRLRQGEGVAATDLRTGGGAMVPAEICLRTRDSQKRRIGSGCAAGRTAAEAASSGLWELVERDALVSWWYEGHAPRPLDRRAASGAEQYLQLLRGGAGGRRTILIDISAHPDLPAVAACSFGPDGKGFVAGFAAHADTLVAARKAIRELMQMEFGLLLVEAKVSAGLPLNEDELRQRRRADVSVDHPALAVRGGARDSVPSSSPEELLERGLAAVPGPVHAVDLTRADFGIPVAKIVAPALREVPRDAHDVGLL
ncbi:YcaO-like family protein [Devosia nitrariae]|uniref:YcaO domain-containing protein n=1 Tax=Devosia nitrariae TaxID=2071872 RepID=A0ABQ5W649_9HYPH|nr:YcaO-like family protein [Devosia nitrariae]GLQ55090.1 hypothetical protein GCM10010862_23490 [Devosia nitrariae]